jgi:hypothetical protein
MGLNQQQTMMQRGFTIENQGYSDTVRNLHWGWKQEDFGREARFMTGRQRQIAERGNERDTTLHNMETDQIDKTRDQQQQLWKLEDQRYQIQKAQFEFSTQMQQKQLDASRKYYEENKKFEDQAIKLSRQKFEAEIKMQHDATAAAKQYATQQHQYQETMKQWGRYQELQAGILKTAAQTGYEAVRNEINATNQKLVEFATFIYNIGATVSAVTNKPAAASSGTGAGNKLKAAGGPVVKGEKYWVGELGPEEFVAPEDGEIIPNHKLKNTTQFIPFKNNAPASSGGSNQPINIYIGNEKLGTFVINEIQKELNA